MSYKIVQSVNPSVMVKIPLTQGINTELVRVWNGTPFDLDYYGLGSADLTVIVAGTAVEFRASDFDAGYVTLLPVNNNNVTGTGVVNIMVYNKGDIIPGGTFPVAIPTQTVQAKVSGVQTLSNEGSAVGTEVIDIGDVNFTKLIDIFNDGHGVWNVDQSNVKHQVLLWSTSGNPLIIGASGDTVPFNGAVTIAQTLGITGITTATGNIIANGGMNNNTFRDNTVGNTQITLSNTSPQVNVANDLQIGGRFIPNSPSTTVNGSVGGSITFVAPIWGSGLKMLIAQINAWNSASAATFTFPSGITWGIAFASYGSAVTNTWGLFIGSTAQPQRHLLTLGAAGSAGTDEAITALVSDNITAFALTGGAATSMQVGTTGGSARTGVIVIIGN